mgnify:CR=1 FL=1
MQKLRGGFRLRLTGEKVFHRIDDQQHARVVLLRKTTEIVAICHERIPREVVDASRYLVFIDRMVEFGERRGEGRGEVPANGVSSGRNGGTTIQRSLFSLRRGTIPARTRKTCRTPSCRRRSPTSCRLAAACARAPR